jgi:serine/threonine-protein kinase
MSPEQIRGEPVDGRADVFALGAILFEVLSGETLYPRGKDALAATVAGAIVGEPSKRRPEAEIAPELDKVCVAATRLAPSDRIATARAFGDQIQSYLDGDRDVEMRRQLAKVALASARESLADGDDRRGALRAASRALALDPESKEPAELVGRLMLDPPTKVPAEVDAQVAEIERKALEITANQGNRALPVFLTFLPILYFGGIDDTWYLFVIPVLAFGVWFGTWLQHVRRVSYGIIVSMLANMGLVVVFSRLVSPFLVAPTLGVTIAILFALHRASGRVLLVGVGFLVAILAPWFLEILGVLSPTMRATAHHATQTRLQLQAWQLRQLVPETS